MGFELEKVGEKKISELCKLAKTIWSEHYLPIIGQAQVDYMLENFQSEKAVSEQIKDGYLYFLIKSDGENCGYLAIQPQGDKLFLSKFYIHSDFRGRGLGRKTFDFVVEFARKLNLPKIKLTVNKYNDNSVAVYKKLGLKIADSIVSDIGNGFVMDDYVFEYEIF